MKRLATIVAFVAVGACSKPEQKPAAQGQMMQDTSKMMMQDTSKMMAPAAPAAPAAKPAPMKKKKP